MEGDIAPLNIISKIAKTHTSSLIIDDAHGIGILGENGRGASESHHLDPTNEKILIMPLGKAFNAIGAVVAGRKDVIDRIAISAKSYRYTTTLPPAICSALQTSLKIVADDNWRRSQLKNNIKFFIDYAQEKKIALLNIDLSPIKPILIACNNSATAIHKYLLKNNFYVPVIMHPTVAENKARLRISLNCMHNKKQITQLLDLISKVKL